MKLNVFTFFVCSLEVWLFKFISLLRVSVEPKASYSLSLTHAIYEWKYVILLICGMKESRFIETERKMVVSRGYGDRGSGGYVRVYTSSYKMNLFWTSIVQHGGYK